MSENKQHLSSKEIEDLEFDECVMHRMSQAIFFAVVLAEIIATPIKVISHCLSGHKPNRDHTR